MALNKETTPLINGLLSQVDDIDTEETQEWIDSFEALVDDKGGPRARYILLNLLRQARIKNIPIPSTLNTPYVNTIGVHEEAYFPGDEQIEKEIRSWIRWNAAVMVTRAQRPGISVGGHISSYASVAALYEVGFNHFFRGKNHPDGGDHVFFQGHTSPGVYARAFVEGRLSEQDLDGFRQEKSQAPHGLPSYPHPRCLPDFWEFPTVSMGLGPAQAIYQAWVNKYMAMRGIKDTSAQRVWAFLGDGEMDEPESRGMLQLAGQQGLDNLTFVVNCNLQRLDGPVRGNGKIIQELEAFFKGAGWNVIKVIWGRGWDTLLNADKDRALVNIMNECVDGDYQTFRANDGAYIRKHFFGRDPRTARLVENWTDEQIWNDLRRGGHDYRKLYAAYKAACEHTGQPTVILAHTVKGWSLGSHFAGRNSTHQMKKLDLDDLKQLRDRLRIPITDEQLEANPKMPPYYMPDKDSVAYQYMLSRRQNLGGFLPSRYQDTPALPIPPDKTFATFKKGSGSQQIASTMAFVRLLKELTKDPEIGKLIVPILPDEARTFGMEAMFPSAKIFNTLGQNYTPVDNDMMLSYKESKQGQILHTGINEAGSAATLQVLGTSYATNRQHMIPVYLFYSMFGFQRTGDQFWAAGDQLARGFIIGATAGRTTLQGEGLQHMDGHSPILAGTNRAVVQYDPAYAYEIAHIIKDGLKRMYGSAEECGDRDPNVMYYLTVYNEPITHPAEPENLDVDGLLKGIYNISTSDPSRLQVQLLASGIALPWAEKAKYLLEKDWGISAGVWSVTSWQELRREALDVEKANWQNPTAAKQVPYLTAKLQGHAGPFIATSDYDHLLVDQVAKWIPGSYHTLGADGFGFSDTRAAARRYFAIDAESMVVRALYALAEEGKIDYSTVQQAIEKYDLHNVNAKPAE